MEGGGVEPHKCSRSKRASLESICASRAFSFFSCAISLSSCFILCFRSIDLISRSTTGCQLSLESQRRQRGKEERNSDLLIELEGWAPKDVDMVITREQRDQGEQKAGDQRDPALEVESEQHRSQPKH